MGYNVYFSGEITISPPLSSEQVQEFNDLAEQMYNEKACPKGAPNTWCNWRVASETLFIADSAERWDSVISWLRWLQKHCLPDVQLNGRIHWSGEENEDMGYIVMQQNRIHVEDAIVTYKRVPAKQMFNFD